MLLFFASEFSLQKTERFSNPKPTNLRTKYLSLQTECKREETKCTTEPGTQIIQPPQILVRAGQTKTPVAVTPACQQ